MSAENTLILLAANLGGLYFRLFSRHAFETPRKAIILKPGDISGVMLATPLLVALHNAFPKARFDWAVSTFARPAVAGNRRIDSLVDAGPISTSAAEWEDVGALIELLKVGDYDTCFIPDASTLLSYIAWKAEIPQRVGINIGGRGFAHTIPVKAPKGQQHETQINLALAKKLGFDSNYPMEFYPSDSDRASVTTILVDELGWDSVMPLVIIHPGQGDEPLTADETKLWPVERYALLAGRLARKYGSRIILAGGEQERALASAVNGLVSASAVNLAGRLSLGKLGALCEMADLYVGGQAGPTYVAAAVGCPTLALFGAGDPAVSGPYGANGRVVSLAPEKKPVPFTWENAVTVDQALAAAERLLTNS